MCGLAGVWAPSEGATGAELEQAARAMADMLRHRGPDDEGVWVDASAGYAVGFRRLSILDLSPAGHQPMVSASGRYVLAFNGEIYNFRDLRQELAATGVRFRSSSDTEVLLEGVERWGLRETLTRLNGMFAFALWDTVERRLMLARDRLGEKPMYYGWSRKHFLFGSQLGALARHPAFDASIDRDVVASFLRYNYVPGSASIHAGFRRLPPGTFLELDASVAGTLPEPAAYWSLSSVVRDPARVPRSADDALEAFDELLGDAVSRRMISDVPLGAFLSGGIDSSAIVALMQRASSRPVRTFTIGFHEAGYDEARDAREVAAHLGTDHTELYLTAKDALDVVPELPGVYDEPFADSSQIPTLLVSRLAREHVTVVLSGDGGDELFGGYTRYFYLRRLWNALRLTPAPARHLLARTVRSVPPDRWDNGLRRLAAVAGRESRTRIGDRMHKGAALLTRGGPDELFQDLLTVWSNPEQIVRGAGRSRPVDVPGAPADLVSRAMYADTLTYLPDDILVKVDRASMATSLEARVPLLDHRVVEYAWGLPQDLKARRPPGKWLLRQLLYRHVPPALVDRPKMGFGVPIGGWLRGPLREWAEDLLSEAALSRVDLLEPAPVRRVWEEHLSGRRDWKYQLWGVLMLQAWATQAPSQQRR